MEYNNKAYKLIMTQNFHKIENQTIGSFEIGP